MRISRIILKSWRNFRSVDVDLQRRVFLIGPNASGKSNFLDAFRFLHDIAKPLGGGLLKSISDRGGDSKIRCLWASGRSSQIEIEVHITGDKDSDPNWRYAISIKRKQEGKHDPVLEYEKVWRDDRLILDRPNKKDIDDPKLLTQTHLQQTSANKEFREIADYFSSFRYFHLVPQLLRYPEAFAGKSMEEDPFGREFLEDIYKTNKRTTQSRLNKIERALKIAVPYFSKLQVEKDDSGKPHLQIRYENWRPHGAKQTEEELSDGTLRFIGFLWTLLEGNQLLLFEEPELSLHTAVIRNLPRLIWRIQEKENSQVIISTHSIELLSDEGIEGEEVLVLIPGEKGTAIKPASSIENVRLLMEGGMSVVDAVIPITEPKDINQLDLFDV
ncbi:MAG: AAA family ATPase [Deltaproteobacteria bacterium]|uniref:AAA family ATPase n=1 Tax=Candidatus Zymogenus saltonus TaxID=2844893 RepID=A0A9D8KG88_9DELT|nr:AAA family ATPase [Candidatus Zymogenus saltonus]